MELIATGVGQLLYVHDKAQCAGRVCSIHNQTDHRMRGWPQCWRADRKIMERVCSHGVGHPDPDEMRIRNGQDDGTHGCDGCCTMTSPDDHFRGMREKNPVDLEYLKSTYAHEPDCNQLHDGPAPCTPPREPDPDPSEGGWRCQSCGETVSPEWAVGCLECGHTWPSGWALWLHTWRMYRRVDLYPFRLLLRPPSRLWVCPCCGHDL